MSQSEHKLLYKLEKNTSIVHAQSLNSLKQQKGKSSKSKYLSLRRLCKTFIKFDQSNF